MGRKFGAPSQATRTERLHIPITPRVKRLIKQAADLDRRSMATFVEIGMEKYCNEILATKGTNIDVVGSEVH